MQQYYYIACIAPLSQYCTTLCNGMFSSNTWQAGGRAETTMCEPEPGEQCYTSAENSCQKHHTSSFQCDSCSAVSSGNRRGSISANSPTSLDRQQVITLLANAKRCLLRLCFHPTGCTTFSHFPAAEFPPQTYYQSFLSPILQMYPALKRCKTLTKSRIK